jgi:hypothetical protein
LADVELLNIKVFVLIVLECKDVYR